MPNGEPTTMNLESGAFDVAFPFSRPLQAAFAPLHDNPDDLIYRTFLGGRMADDGSGIVVDGSETVAN